MKHLTWLLFAGLAGTLLAGGFVPPTEGPVAFRRDRIPLEADAMAELSRQLETLARGLNAENAGDRRGAAQMLALALALDPSNAEARHLVSQYQQGGHLPKADATALERARSKVWNLIGWLESTEAGTDGRALGGCLKDIIPVSDPKHPQAAALRSGGEKGAWAGWIPDLAAYETKAVVNNESEKSPLPETPDNNKPRLEHAELRTVLWQRTGRPGAKKWVLEQASLEMNARMLLRDDGSAQPPPFTIAIGQQPGLDPLPRLADALKNLLRAEHGELPRGIRVRITAQDLEQSIQDRRHQTLSAAAAVLADSAITGRVPDAIILGVVNETGAYTVPGGFWDQLRALGKGDGRRLILPAGAVDFIDSMLALEKPEFFLEYEVLLAADFKQLVALASRGPEDSESPASAKFREIRERAGNGDVRPYLGNSFVKQRLAGVLQDMPAHVSAKMLLIQASGKRPVHISRKVAAAELRHAIAPVGQALPNNRSEETSISLGQIYDFCRAKVDGIERYVDKNDRQLVAEARETVIAVRTLDRTARLRNDPFNASNAVFEARNTLTRLYFGLIRTLDAEADGEPRAGNSRPGGITE